jgi:hypothetical protein
MLVAVTLSLVRIYNMDKPIYELVDAPFQTKVLQRTDPDGKVWIIPTDPANSDYQAYLKSQEVTND